MCEIVNLSMSSLGVFSDACSKFLDMMNDIGIDKNQQRYIITKMINIAIRVTYYIFCCRNRTWDSLDLIQFWFWFVLLLLFVCFFLFFFYFLFFYFFNFSLIFFIYFCLFYFALFLFNNSISSSICKLPIRREIYNCTFKNTNKVPIIIAVVIIIIIILPMNFCPGRRVPPQRWEDFALHSLGLHWFQQVSKSRSGPMWDKESG